MVYLSFVDLRSQVLGYQNAREPKLNHPGLSKLLKRFNTLSNYRINPYSLARPVLLWWLYYLNRCIFSAQDSPLPRDALPLSGCHKFLFERGIHGETNTLVYIPGSM